MNVEEILIIYKSHSLIPYIVLSSAFLFLLTIIWEKLLKPSSLVMRRLYLLVIFLPFITYPVFYFSYFRSCGYAGPGGESLLPVFWLHLVCRLGGLISTWVVPLSLMIFVFTIMLSFKAYKNRNDFVIKARKFAYNLSDLYMEEMVGELTDEMGLKVKPDVLVIPTTETVSFATGVFKPDIYISEGLLELLNVKELKGVIAHELAHVKLKDTGWDVVMTLIGYLLFFSPFSLFGKEMYKKQREKACDVLASLYTEEPLSLGRGLLKLKKYQNNKPIPVLTGFAWKKGHTAERVENLLWFEDNGYDFKFDRVKELAFIILAVMFLLYLC